MKWKEKAVAVFTVFAVGFKVLSVLQVSFKVNGIKTKRKRDDALENISF